MNLNVEICFDRMLDGLELDRLQEILRSCAPEWSSELHLEAYDRDRRRPVDISERGAIRNILAPAGERGSTYEAMVETYGRPPHERLFGSVELRGKKPELLIVVSVDEYPLFRMRNGHLKLGNSIDFQLRRKKVAGREASEWAFEVFEQCCRQMTPVWGAAYPPGQYDEKVMSEGPSVRAIGRDFSRWLPGLFWLNFFGPRYVGLIGQRRLLSAAENAREVDSGVLVPVAEDPKRWDSEEYRQVERCIVEHIGQEYFFSKAHPDRPGKAPDWEA